MSLRLGGHVSTAGSLANSVDRAIAIGANCSQIFISPPQQWRLTEHSEVSIQEYRDQTKSLGISPNFIHGSYLINLGSADTDHLNRSIETLTYSQKVGFKLGIQGTIFHIGSHKGLGFTQVVTQVCQAISKILENSPSQIELILETSVGGGGNIGSFLELAELLRTIQAPNLKVCLDTQHIFAAGFDVRTSQGLNKSLATIEETFGLDKLSVIHLNDSKVELAGKRDRHENIGEGFIGEEGIANVINHPALKELPFILEVPGQNKGGPDKENLDRVKKLIHT